MSVPWSNYCAPQTRTKKKELKLLRCREERRRIKQWPLHAPSPTKQRITTPRGRPYAIRVCLSSRRREGNKHTRKHIMKLSTVCFGHVDKRLIEDCQQHVYCVGQTNKKHFRRRHCVRVACVLFRSQVQPKSARASFRGEVHKCSRHQARFQCERSLLFGVERATSASLNAARRERPTKTVAETRNLSADGRNRIKVEVARTANYLLRVQPPPDTLLCLINHALVKLAL